MNRPTESRTYLRAECAVFRKTAEAFGGLSNMAPGYPVRTNGVRIFTVEALYQACRFPHLPDVQQLIIGQHSPMTAKMVSKPYRKDSRPDWDRVRVKVMRWCLRVKLSQHWQKFSQLLLSTGQLSIVEDSRKDDFWGALPNENGTLVGRNVLGRLLMELREEIKQGDGLRRVEPPAIENFLLFGEPLQVVDFRTDKNAPSVVEEIGSKDLNDELTLPLFAEAAAAPVRPAVMATSIPERRSTMIEGLKPYAEYKESGLQWAPRVPAHWSLIPNRAVLKKRKVLVGEDHKDFQLLSLTKGGVIVRDISTGKGKFSSDMGTSQEVRKGDLVFCLFDVPETPRTVGLSTHDGMITSAYTVFEARKLPMEGVRYLERFYLAMDDQKLLSPLYSGLRHTIPPPRFLGTKTPQPPADEQAAIVRFLDHANRKIDGFIRAKRKLIGLLNEQKQAIIHRAVTRGLDPDAPLKPSGIPWLGEIPMHWEVMRVKFVVDHYGPGIQMGPFGSSLTSLESRDTGFKLYGQENTISGDFSRGNRWLRRDQFASLRKYELLPGDIVLTRKGSIGKARIVPTDISRGIADSDTIRVRLDRRLVAPEFVVEVLHTSTYVLRQLEMSRRGAILGGLNTATIGDILLVLPPQKDQSELLAGLRAETAPLNTAIARTEREIALMQEYRTRLTADIVTGKLDVRAAAAKLPDLPTESAGEAFTEAALDDTEIEDAEA